MTQGIAPQPNQHDTDGKNKKRVLISPSSRPGRNQLCECFRIEDAQPQQQHHESDVRGQANQAPLILVAAVLLAGVRAAHADARPVTRGSGASIATAPASVVGTGTGAASTNESQRRMSLVPRAFSWTSAPLMMQPA